MAYNEDFRALASIMINENIPTEMKSKAGPVMEEIIDLMKANASMERKNLEEFLRRTEAKIVEPKNY